ncbi:gephyrin-like molybdotransferase Glp [Sandarakinorhabdus sp. AAP62]|uniref:molybdopterin molybdotransferase MoeA n=1 Tax=Sandarakinorhabdus sp. AAP62 TaxID=1248916 RepID=UPI0002D5D0E4|nr:gephyrin-like molybdotransferase Glp [Sandarakinorhabdus sp. AAP62]
MSGLLPFQEALDQLLSGVEALPAETLPLDHCAGRVLAEPVIARLTQPPFAAAAMDGYAIRWADLQARWRVVGESAAGHGWAGSLGPGEAVRIFTGAPVPNGADVIVVQEEVTRDGAVARLAGEGPLRPQAHIRPAGQDFAAGDSLIAASTRLSAAHLGLAAAGGWGALPVVRRPRVTLIATGDELVQPGKAPGPGQIISANPVMLTALLRAAGADVHDPGIIPDHRTALAAALQAAAADLIITIGGASVGDHDLVVPVLRELGADIDFWKIALRPGKPLLAGRLGGTRVLGLPGNPVSAFVTALLFAVPLVSRLGGRGHELPLQRLKLAAPLPANGPRRDHLRARRTPAGAEPFARQDSALLALLAQAELLIIREAHAPAAAAGDEVTCIALDMFHSVF